MERGNIYERGPDGLGGPYDTSLGDGEAVESRPTSELFDELTAQARRLVRAEVKLAKAEMRDRLEEARAGTLSVVAGAVTAYLGALALVACLIALIALALPVWVSALIVGGVLLIAGAFAVTAGIKKLKKVRGRSSDTLETLKEDKQWLRETTHDVKSRVRAEA